MPEMSTPVVASEELEADSLSEVQIAVLEQTEVVSK